MSDHLAPAAVPAHETLLTPSFPAPARAGLGWRIALWVAQLLLAAEFAMAGYFKVFMPYAQLVKMAQEMHGAIVPEGLMHFIGVSELLGALGMILPALTRVQPKLTAWAAVGLGTIMVLASGLHLSRGEYGEVAMTLTLLAISAFVAWGRFKKAPIVPRG
jgi:uncharacterized membrane protein YphA (DoxX/SURF4 family)